MREKTIIGLLLLALACTTGCFNMAGGIAPSTTPLGDRDYDVVDADAVGKDCVWRLLEIIPISGGNHADNAIESALRAHRADGLIDVTVENYSRHLLIVGLGCTRVKGKAIRFK